MKLFLCFLSASWIFISSFAQQNSAEVSHYLFPSFTQGIVLMKDGKRNNALLNYNSLSEEMIFDKNDMKLAIGKKQLPNIDTVFIETRKFVVLKGKFVELIYNSNWVLYVEHKCKVEAEGASTGYGGTSQTSAASSASLLQTQGEVVYELELPDGYQTFPYSFYWVRDDTAIYHFRNVRELKKQFPDKKDAIKKYSKTNRIKYDDQQSIIQLIAFLESS